MSQMNKIAILPEDLTNKIAAGEVVDRPSAVVKELIENAIDAGSDKITIILKDGGKSLIQIVDNGAGMNREDAILSIQRHSTSKIASYDDLHNIQTLGFRGEALASIASVSRLEIKTMTQDQSAGTLIKIDGGVIGDIASTGGVRGTSISVKNLFYNTPARRKFLKSDEAEYRNILAVINRFMLSYCQVEFSLHHNDKQIYEYKAASLEDRVVDVLGSRYKDQLLQLNDDSTMIEVSGFIGKQDTAKKSRAHEFLFLNGRYIVNRSLNHAIISAYGTIIPRGEFPLFVVFLNIDARHVDVNVHPSKMEVKFADERAIYSILRKAVLNTLSTANVIPQFSVSTPHHTAEKNFTGHQSMQTQFSLTEYQRATPMDLDKFITAGAETEAASEHHSGDSRHQPDEKHFERTHVWQIHNQYIVSEIKSGIIVIDQHVAHERILYEKALRSFEIKKPSSQQLLFPILYDMTPEEYSLLSDILPFLENIGFIIKGFGGHSVVVEGVPTGLKLGEDEKILSGIIDEFKKNRNSTLDVRDNVAKSYACKTAIKAGDKLSLAEMNSLIDQLFATQSPYFCPHGRPVVINISKEELDKRFGRI